MSIGWRDRWRAFRSRRMSPLRRPSGSGASGQGCGEAGPGPGSCLAVPAHSAGSCPTAFRTVREPGGGTGKEKVRWRAQAARATIRVTLRSARCPGGGGSLNSLLPGTREEHGPTGNPGVCVRLSRPASLLWWCLAQADVET